MPQPHAFSAHLAPRAPSWRYEYWLREKAKSERRWTEQVFGGTRLQGGSTCPSCPSVRGPLYLRPSWIEEDPFPSPFRARVKDLLQGNGGASHSQHRAGEFPAGLANKARCLIPGSFHGAIAAAPLRKATIRIDSASPATSSLHY